MDNKKLIEMLPPVTDANRDFWEGALAGELRLQYGDSGIPRYPEAPVDPVTLAADFEWRAASGRATLWSWIVMHQKYFPAFADEVPYLVAFVQLEEGPYVMTTLVDPPENLQCGMPLEVVFDQIGEDRAIPKFKVVSA
ncbi:Zn-ribbon domain-containing OB-fold protein [Streptomyces sp. NBC_01235]|uniref:Zn-ribbon domain-containing OB-fold protein n=1 Tax=Streptomyces sp. NBC_01235 TaxID=2903788 RepID=UPI002E0FB14C|nr:OB-fold domain-containing protein [Streptomyces sp. NBC_01235]